jgi:phosphoglycerate dehydrogenase-like enzyme
MSGFRVGFTRDMRATDGEFQFGEQALQPFREAGILWEFVPEHGRDLGPEQVSEFSALVVFGSAVGEDAIAGAPKLELLARVGVGVDSVDVDACTRHGVYVAITPDGVRVPIATAAVAMLLSLAYRLLEKDSAAREPGWGRRLGTVGVGLTGKSVGLVGYGNLGREIASLLQPFRVRCLAFSPSLTAERAGPGVECVSLETLLRISDVIILACPLTSETRNLLNAGRISQLRPGALVVNISRGAVIDQHALAAALADGRVGGAALDVFAEEPLPPGDPILAAPNVLLAPHSAGYVDELFTGCLASAAGAITAVIAGRAPEYLVNPEVVGRSELAAKVEARRGYEPP